jgi:hypothetical protein
MFKTAEDFSAWSAERSRQRAKAETMVKSHEARRGCLQGCELGLRYAVHAFPHLFPFGITEAALERAAAAACAELLASGQ